MPCIQCENTSASATHCCLGKERILSKMVFGGFFFIFSSQMCCLSGFAKAMHPAYSCLQLLTPELDFGSFTSLSIEQDELRGTCCSAASNTAMHEILVSFECCPHEHGKIVIKNKKETKKVFVSKCLLLKGSSGHPQALRRLLE